MEIQIKPILDKLIEQTKGSLCHWEMTKNETYRLLLRNGSIIVQKGEKSFLPNPLLPDVLYTIKFFDSESCFYELEITDESSHEYWLVDSLYLSIKEVEEKTINDKLSSLLNAL